MGNRFPPQSSADLRKELLWLDNAIKDDALFADKRGKRREWKAECLQANTACKAREWS